MKTPSQYISSLSRIPIVSITSKPTGIGSSLASVISRPSIYYPGSGTDIAPVDLFIKGRFVSTAVYADYMITPEQIEEMFIENESWKIERQRELNPEDFGLSAWGQFWPEIDESYSFARPGHAFCKLMILRSADSRLRIHFLVIATEAIETYIRLIDLGFHPTVVIVQDHGFGCNWTDFGGNSMLYSIAQSHLPEMIYVASNTKPWPGYRQVSEYGSPEGSAGHPRAIWRVIRRQRGERQVHSEMSL